jgi:hypothetical protein
MAGTERIKTVIFAILFPLAISDYKVAMTTAFDSKVRFLHLQSSLTLSGTTNTTVPYQMHVRVLTEGGAWPQNPPFPVMGSPQAGFQHFHCT